MNTTDTQREKTTAEFMQTLKEHPELLGPAKALTEILLSGQELLTIPDLEKILRTTAATIHRWIDNGEIHAVKDGTEYAVHLEDLKAFLKNRIAERQQPQES